MNGESNDLLKLSDGRRDLFETNVRNYLERLNKTVFRRTLLCNGKCYNVTSIPLEFSHLISGKKNSYTADLQKAVMLFLYGPWPVEASEISSKRFYLNKDKKGDLKATYECCAKCCDASYTRNVPFHDCTEICAARMLDQRDYARDRINELRISLEKCARSCREKAIQMQQKFQHTESIKMFDTCTQECLQEHSYRLPLLIEEIIEQMQQRFIIYRSP